MREYTDCLVWLGFRLVDYYKIEKELFLIYFSHEKGCILTVKTKSNIKEVGEVYLYCVWYSDIDYEFARHVLFFACKEDSGVLRKIKDQYILNQSIAPSIDLLINKFELLKEHGFFEMPWPAKPDMSNIEKNVDSFYKGSVMARLPAALCAVTSPQ